MKLALQERYRVKIYEMERGWGRKLDETIDFDNAVEAIDYVHDYNAGNTLKNTPDWYMYAEYVGKV